MRCAYRNNKKPGKGGVALSFAIEVKGLSKTFRPPFRLKKVRAVRSITFGVEYGEVFGFLGPNGAGKTTTIKILTGLIKPTAGSAFVLGGHPSAVEVRAKIGYLPEQPYFYDYLKPTELLDIFGRLFGIDHRDRQRRINELLDLVGLSHAKDRTLRKYSKGMLQRVGLAQALLNDPHLLILDEPMSGLDPIGRKEFADLIASLKAKGKTIFFSSHILADIERLCDRVVILDKGEIKAQGKLDDLLAGGKWEKEIVVRDTLGIKKGGLASLPGVSVVEELDAQTFRVVTPGEALGQVLASLIESRFEIVSVVDRKISLEDLLVQITRAGSEAVA